MNFKPKFLENKKEQPHLQSTKSKEEIGSKSLKRSNTCKCSFRYPKSSTNNKRSNVSKKKQNVIFIDLDSPDINEEQNKNDIPNGEIFKDFKDTPLLPNLSTKISKTKTQGLFDKTLKKFNKKGINSPKKKNNLSVCHTNNKTNTRIILSIDESILDSEHEDDLSKSKKKNKQKNSKIKLEHKQLKQKIESPKQKIESPKQKSPKGPNGISEDQSSCYSREIPKSPNARTETTVFTITPSISEINKQFLLSCEKGDKDSTLFFLSCPDLKINYQDDKGYSALHYACEDGNFKIVDALIKYNIDVNLLSKDDQSPLHISAKNGSFDISKMLVENGAKIEALDKYKNLPVHLSASVGHIELTCYFLDRYNTVLQANKYGKTPYDLIKDEKGKEILKKYLVKNKPKKNAQPSSRQSKSNIRGGTTKDENIESPDITKTKRRVIVQNKSQNTVSIFKPNPMTNNKSAPSNIGKAAELEKKAKEIKSGNKARNVLSKNIIKPKKSSNTSTSLKGLTNGDNNKSMQAGLDVNNSYFQNKINQKGFLPNQSALDHSCLDCDGITIKHRKSKKGEKKCSLNFYNDKHFFRSKSKNNVINKKNLSVPKYHHFFDKNKVGTDKRKKTANVEISLDVYQKRDSDGTNHSAYTENNAFEKALTKEHIFGKQNFSQRTTTQTAFKSKLNINNSHKKGNVLSDITHETVKGKQTIKSITTKTASTKASTTQKSTNNTKIIKGIHSPNKSPNKRIIQIKPIENLTQNDIDSENENEDDDDDDDSVVNELGPASTSYRTDMVSIMSLSSNTLAPNTTTISEKITPGSFYYLGLLGTGSFGFVYLVKKKDSDEKYAMKVLDKNLIMSQNIIKYAKTERNVLSAINHPFIVKLRCAFQTKEKLFLLLDYCPGGDLSKQIQRESRFKEAKAKFYLCEIILAIGELHKHDIIFRDLKPDNVVLDTQGHALLTDFGLSKEGVHDNLTARSFCGSIAYLAPEMLNRSGHGKAVDWYLIGVLFYEMLVGITPFFNMNKQQIFKDIRNSDLQVPSFVSPKAKELLEQLLIKDPLKRLGATNDVEEVKSHHYFKDVNWEDVYQRKLTPPSYSVKCNDIQLYDEPKLFEEDEEECENGIEANGIDKNFEGWSFINDCNEVSVNPSGLNLKCSNKKE